jgi:putative intracellular protease/amidase
VHFCRQFSASGDTYERSADKFKTCTFPIVLCKSLFQNKGGITMYRIRSIVLITIILMLIVGCSSVKKNSDQVLLILREQLPDKDIMEYMLTNEVGVMKSMLEKAGYKVITASPSGQPLMGNLTTLKPDLKLADVNTDDYAGIILPCMAVDMATQSPKEAIENVKKAVEQGKPVAAQTGGLLYLRNAGVLKGIHFASIDDHVSLYPDGIHQGSGVVQDGKIITSGVCPFVAFNYGYKDGTPELTQKFIDTLNSSKNT